MSDLSFYERELVALAAAMGSNCAPCIEHHIPEARKAGLSETQISEAIRLADKVRQVPARKVLDVAWQMLRKPSAEGDLRDAAVSAIGASSVGATCCD